jgi:uncharacterized protein (TIGR02246 family)
MRSFLFFISLFASVIAPLAAATPTDEVAATTKAWADAFNTRDPERVLALYETDAVLWGTTSPILRKTPAARREYFSAMPQRPNLRVAIGEQHVRVFGDVAVNSGTYTFTNNQDGKVTSNHSRFSFTYVRKSDRWLIVDHHSSAVPAAPVTASK